jgi:hypothetical protein
MRLRKSTSNRLRHIKRDEENSEFSLSALKQYFPTFISIFSTLLMITTMFIALKLHLLPSSQSQVADNELKLFIAKKS